MRTKPARKTFFNTGGPGPGSHEKASDVLGKQRERGGRGDTCAPFRPRSSRNDTRGIHKHTGAYANTCAPKHCQDNLAEWSEALAQGVRKGVGSNPTAVTLLARGRRVDLEGLIPFEGGGGGGGYSCNITR